MKFISKLKAKIDSYNRYHNPFYIWWKCRNYFKRPKCHFLYGKNIWFFGLYIDKKYYNPIIHFRTSAVGWKWKWDEPRHEWDPFIQICLFRKYHLIWVFNWVKKDDKKSYVRSMATWEAILSYLYNKKNLVDSIVANEWGENDEIITPLDNLK